ncbi:MAG TPA: hypothetical protein VMU78_08015, partial [Methylocella sp.]|nr:hypothetical protein [Methylocella sp.]
MTSPDGCRCAYCKNETQFDIPSHLIEELQNNNVVVFAGAGISTENRDYAKDTFYDTIAHELNTNDKRSFSEIMEAYCKQP